MAVRDTLNKIEELVAKAPHLPLTNKTIISEETLIHLVEDLRKDLPQELEHATEVMHERENIIKNAQAEADNIIKQAREEAARLVDENDIVVKAREKSRMVLSQAQQQEVEIMERTRRNSKQLQEDADNYANQVFDNLITFVTNTFQGIRQAQSGMENALQVLQQAKVTMNQQAAQQAYAQSYGVQYDQGYVQPAQPQQQYNQQPYDQSQQYNQQYPQEPR